MEVSFILIDKPQQSNFHFQQAIQAIQIPINSELIVGCLGALN